MTLSRYLLRETRRRCGRAVLTIIGIVIGVQALVAVPVTISTTRQAYRNLFEGVSGQADLEIVAVGHSPFDAALAARLADTDGVSAATGAVQGVVTILDSGGPRPVIIVGMTAQATSTDFKLRSGTIPDGDGQAVVSADYASSLGLVVGDEVMLLTVGGARALRITGVATPRGLAAVGAADILWVHWATAQHALGLGDQINAIKLVIEDGMSVEEVMAEIAPQLPDGLRVQAPASRAAFAEASMATTEMLLSTLSIIALATGAFVILNTFLMNVTERRRELAILRALGSTARQVARMLLLETLVLALVGTAIGIPLGVAVAYIMMELMSQMMVVAMPTPQVTIDVIVLAALLGIGAALLATWIPARRAAARPPLHGLSERPSGVAGGSGVPAWIGWSGVVLLGIGGVIVGWIFSGAVPAGLYVFLLPACMSLGVVAIAAIVPMVLRPLLFVVGRLLRPILGIESMLAVRQLLRRPVRAGLVVSVLTVSIVVSVAFGNSILLSVDDVFDWCDTIITSDFLVRAHRPEPSSTLTAAIPDTVEVELEHLDGVDTVVPLSFVQATAADRQVIVLARTWPVDGPLGIELFDGQPHDVHAGLHRGEVVVGSHLAQEASLHIGDTIAVDTRDGVRHPRICGIATEYTAGGFILYADWDLMRTWLRFQGVHVYLLTAERGAQDRVAAGLDSICSKHGLVYQSRAGFRQDLDHMMGGVVGSFWALLLLVFVVASLGVTNSLTMNVLEQTRELGVLRAIAMRRSGVCRMIAVQGLALGWVSIVPGVLGGALLSVLVVKTTYPITGFEMEYALSIPLILGCMGLTLLVSVAASMPPVWRVSRMSVVRALQYE